MTAIVTIASSISSLVVQSQPKNSENHPLQWEHLYQGVDFIQMEYGKWFKKGHLYAIKLSNTRKLRFLVDNKNITSLKDLEDKYKPLIVVNGGYFQENFLPSGLLKIKNKVIGQFNKSGGSGILAIKDQDVKIFHKKQINIYKNSYPDLMQNGPLLVEKNGQMGIYADDHEYNARTAIGLTKDNKILIIVADRAASPSLWELSSLLTKEESKGGFACKSAINMDGGPSTGLRINLPNKNIVVEESANIANGIGVF
ncbi:MAG: phosphodiester glycosidase family protein [Candidatus Sericytochromatia bacterium]|nr:phosphodiester glycosidase family protein [Candidatus Sericytochromatia bacterium]